MIQLFIHNGLQKHQVGEKTTIVSTNSRDLSFNSGLHTISISSRSLCLYPYDFQTSLWFGFKIAVGTLAWTLDMISHHIFVCLFYLHMAWYNNLSTRGWKKHPVGEKVILSPPIQQTCPSTQDYIPYQYLQDRYVCVPYDF